MTFLTGNRRVVLAETGSGFTMPVFYHYALKEGGKVKWLTNLRQLTGKVLIKNFDDALAFVRLRTDPDYSFRLGNWSIEIMSRDKAKANGHLFSDEMNGYAFVVTTPETVRVSDAYPVIEKDGDGYDVTRLLVLWSPSKDWRAWKVKEFVGHTGKWRISSKTQAGLGPLAAVPWYMPAQM